jgi:hypothetical protein
MNMYKLSDVTLNPVRLRNLEMLKIIQFQKKSQGKPIGSTLKYHYIFLRITTAF